MNFFRNKQKAKNKTFLLLILFVISFALISLLISVVLVLVIKDDYSLNVDLIEYIIQNIPFMFLKVFPIIVLVIGIGSAYKLYELYSNGGSYVASSLGGRLIQRDTNNFSEKILYNIVEEMSIASGIIVPKVYIIQDDSINAFAAGYSLDDTVVALTSGSIEKLTRDELQGVVAHEFSHIFNGDMKINMNLIGALHGLFFIKEIGRIILDSTNNVHMGISFNSRKDDGKSQVMIIAFVFLVFGYIGYFFGQIIKAAINRQREYLADASAVQYTRDIFGISNALKKIGTDSILVNSNLKQSANLYSHMFFSNISELFSSHPPLDERIKKIDKNWDGVYTMIPVNNNEIENSYTSNIKKDKSLTMDVALVLASIGLQNNINQNNINQAKENIKNIPDEIIKHNDSSFGALCILLSFIVNKNPKLASSDFDIIEKNYGKVVVSQIRQIWLSSKKMDQQQTLICIELIFTKLMLLSKEQYLLLKSTFATIIKNDGQITYFEWLLDKLVINKLDISFKIKKIPRVKYNNIKNIKKEVEILLSIFVSIENQNDTISESLFTIASEYCNLNDIKYIKNDKHKFDILELALEKIKKSNQDILKIILSSLVRAYNIDNVITINEYYLLKILSIYFNIPLYIQDKETTA